MREFLVQVNHISDGSRVCVTSVKVATAEDAPAAAIAKVAEGKISPVAYVATVVPRPRQIAQEAKTDDSRPSPVGG